MVQLRSLSNLLWVAAPKTMGGLAMMWLNVSLLKWFTPETFGVYAICLAALTLLAEGLFGSAIDLAVLRQSSVYYQRQQTRAVWQVEFLGVKFKLIGIGLCAGVVCVCFLLISRWFFRDMDLRALAGVTGLAACAVLMLGSAMLHLQVRERFFVYGVTETTNLLVKFGGIALTLYWFSAHNWALPPWTILAWLAVGPLAAICIVGIYSVSQRLPQVESSEFVPSDKLGRELFDSVKWILVTLLISALANKVDVFLLTSLSSMKEVGIYTGGQTLANIPLLFGSYLAILLNPKVMPYYESGRLLGLMRKVQLGLLVASVVGYGCVLLLYDPLKEWFLPPSFAPSSAVILTLLPMTLLAMTSYPLVVALLLFVRPRWLVWMECLTLPMAVVGYLWLVPAHGAWGAAVVTALIGVLKTVIAQWVAFSIAMQQSPTQNSKPC